MNSELDLFADAVASAEHHDADILNMHEQFQRYLDRTGTTSKLVDALVKVLDATQADARPTALEDSRNYFLSVLSQGVKSKAELKSLKAEIIKMEQSLDRIRAENTNLRSLLDIPEPPASPSEADEELKKLLDELDDDDEGRLIEQPDSEELLPTFETLHGQGAIAARKLRPGEVLGEDDQDQGVRSTRAPAGYREDSGEFEHEESFLFDSDIDTTDYLEDSEETLDKVSSEIECSAYDSELDTACEALQALQGNSSGGHANEGHNHSHDQK